MVLSLPDCSVSYIIPFKSGKNLIGTTLSHLFRIHDINHFIREDLSGIQECCNIFVRNPVDRFFSCYSWLQNRLKYDVLYEIITNLKRISEINSELGYDVSINQIFSDIQPIKL